MRIVLYYIKDFFGICHFGGVSVSSKKYIKDYRSIEIFDSRGRLHREHAYIGGDYYYCEEAGAVRRRAKLLALLCAVSWICWLVPLLFNNGAMRLPFISVPTIFTALTLWLTSMVAYTALTVQEPMKRRPADRLAKWLPGTTLATAILTGVALVGTAVALIFGIGALNAYDWLFASCMLLVCAAAILCYSQRRFFKTEERNDVLSV